MGKEGISSYGAWTFIKCPVVICLSNTFDERVDNLPVMSLSAIRIKSEEDQ